MKKIIAAAFPLGRVGSSAVMGLLNLSGINVGKKDQLIGPKPMNPKGFFELKSQQEFLEKVYKGIYPGITNPPPLKFLDKTGKEFYAEYNQLMRTEFENCFPIAVKSQRFLTLPFLHHLRKKYYITVLVLERNLEDQVESIHRVWRKSGNTLQKNASREFITDYIEKWKTFAKAVKKYYDFPFFHVSFDDLMKKPINVSREIFDFIGEKCPTEEQITGWLDRTLINRSQLVN
jgi:hypothetical protein